MLSFYVLYECMYVCFCVDFNIQICMENKSKKK